MSHTSKNLTMPAQICSERLTLKRIKPSVQLADQLFQIVVENRDHILPFLEFALPQITGSIDDEYKYLVQAEQDWNNGKRFEYIICPKGKNEVLGCVCVFQRHLQVDKCVEIGYWLKAAATKKGYMNEALRQVAKTCFEKGTARIYIRIDTENQASVHVAQKAGFQKEGVERNGRYNFYFQAFRNMNIFSKIKEDQND